MIGDVLSNEAIYVPETVRLIALSIFAVVCAVATLTALYEWRRKRK